MENSSIVNRAQGFSEIAIAGAAGQRTLRVKGEDSEMQLLKAFTALLLISTSNYLKLSFRDVRSVAQKDARLAKHSLLIIAIPQES